MAMLLFFWGLVRYRILRVMEDGQDGFAEWSAGNVEALVAGG